MKFLSKNIIKIIIGAIVVCVLMEIHFYNESKPKILKVSGPDWMGNYDVDYSFGLDTDTFHNLDSAEVKRFIETGKPF